jgi:LmbE family N-acetylglucosaminyl deacetylase
MAKKKLKKVIFSHPVLIKSYALFNSFNFILQLQFLKMNGNFIDKHLEKEGLKILMLIPHYDDEVLGAFNLLQMEHSRQMIDILYLTDGKGCLTRRFIPNIQEVRKKESEQALANIKIRKTTHCSLPDGKLSDHSAKLEAILEKELKENKYDLVLTTAPSDRTPDHIILSEATEKVLKNDLHTKILYYRSTWSTFPIQCASYIYTGPLKKKKEALANFKSQKFIPLFYTLLFSMREAGTSFPVEGFIHREYYHLHREKFEVVNMLTA